MKESPSPQRKQFTISVYPHVRKYMLKTYGRSGVLRTEEYSILGKLVTLALLDDRGWKNNSSQERDRLTDSLTITLNSEQSKMGPRLYKLERLNQDLDSLFKEALLLWVNAQAALGRGAHPALRSFLEKYGLDPYGNEYSLETAYRYYQRIKNPSRDFFKTSS